MFEVSDSFWFAKMSFPWKKSGKSILENVVALHTSWNIHWTLEQAHKNISICLGEILHKGV